MGRSSTCRGTSVRLVTPPPPSQEPTQWSTRVAVHTPAMPAGHAPEAPSNNWAPLGVGGWGGCPPPPPKRRRQNGRRISPLAPRRRGWALRPAHTNHTTHPHCNSHPSSSSTSPVPPHLRSGRPSAGASAPAWPNGAPVTQAGDDLRASATPNHFPKHFLPRSTPAPPLPPSVGTDATPRARTATAAPPPQPPSPAPRAVRQLPPAPNSCPAHCRRPHMPSSCPEAAPRALPLSHAPCARPAAAPHARRAPGGLQPTLMGI